MMHSFAPYGMELFKSIAETDSVGLGATRVSIVIDQQLDKTALTLARAILSSSVLSAQQIEATFRASRTKPAKFEDRDFQDVVSEFVYVFVHLSVREAFEKRLGPVQRNTFLSSLHNYVLQLGKKNHMTDDHPVPAFTRREEKTDPRILVVAEGMDLLNDRQAEYSRLKLFATPDEPQLKGTLFWEFGKYVMKIYERYEQSPSIQFEAQILASTAYVELIPLFSGLVPPPRAKGGFLRRLFGRN